ncbi:hypothetical protein SAMN03080602_02364 [Arenibacter troitsensis]|uniref:Uncharacterized protein n=1 Tax=Arenibacter troitsensis TaxID=188872 RepID=A0A1X7JYN7_9FLAO|nr:hypothetical protein SAMN03080602_02364 [Arenibacter troitsensis]
MDNHITIFKYCSKTKSLIRFIENSNRYGKSNFIQWLKYYKCQFFNALSNKKCHSKCHFDILELRLHGLFDIIFLKRF